MTKFNMASETPKPANTPAPAGGAGKDGENKTADPAVKPAETAAPAK